VVFEDGAPWSLWDIVNMLVTIFGRDVGLVEKRALRNPFRKRHVLKAHEVIYAS